MYDSERTHPLKNAKDGPPVSVDSRWSLIQKPILLDPAFVRRIIPFTLESPHTCPRHYEAMDTPSAVS